MAEPFVLLHMLGGQGSEWRRLAAHLDAPCLAPNLPGHGADTGAAAAPPRVVTLEEMADHVLQNPGVRDLERFRLVGTSAGGAVATLIAAQWPERVADLTLISTAFTPTSSDEDIAKAEAVSRGRDYDEADLPLPRAPGSSRTAFAIDDLAIHDEIEAARAFAAAWIKPCWRGVAQADVLGLLGGVHVPVMCIYGEHDPYRRFEPAARARLPRAQTHVVPGCGAFPHRQLPDAVAALLR